MHLLKSSFLLLTTAALTSVAVASRPSGATPPATLDVDVTITQRDLDHDHTHEHAHTADTGVPWTDEFSILHGPYQHTYVESARVNTKVAKRAAASATTAAGEEDKEHSNWDYRGQKIPDTLASAYTESAGHHTHRHNETRDETKTHTELKESLTGLPESHKTKSASVAQSVGASLSSALPNPSSSTTIPPTSSPAASASTSAHVNTNTKLVKRSDGAYEYVYDSTTETVTAPHTMGHYDTSKLSTRRKTKTKVSYHSGWLSGSV